MSEDFWIDRAQSAEAKLNTLKAAHAPILERIKNFKANFGVREKDNGEISIDFDKFIEGLGETQAMELKSLIEQRYGKKKRAKAA